MIKRCGIVAFFAFGSVLFGQLDSNSVTVTASRSTNLQPDTVVFAVTVNSDLNTTLDNVLAAVKGAGITITNFEGVGQAAGSIVCVGSGNPPPLGPVQWTFGVSVPFSQMKATIATLGALQTSISQSNPQLSLSFALQGSQVSAEGQQAQACNLPQLITDATAQAQKLATAAGLTLGQILAMSSVTAVPATSTPTALGLASFLIATPLIPSGQVCTLTVKFGLTRF